MAEWNPIDDLMVTPAPHLGAAPPPPPPGATGVLYHRGHNFGTAMEAIIEGRYRGRRAGMTGYVALVGQHFVPMQADRPRWDRPNAPPPVSITFNTVCIPAFVGMFERDTVTPWTPSQDDMTATDWIVE
jgi:hypothetical protein